MTTLTIGDVVLDGNNGVTRVDESGGWNAPEQRTERGFEYSSYVRAEPISGTFEALVEDDTYRRLQRLREQTEPFRASIDHISLTRAKLETLDVEHQGGESHYRITVEIVEVHEAELETAELSLEGSDADQASSSGDAQPSFVQPEEDESDTSDEVTDSGGIVGSLSSVREGLSGVLS